MFAIRLGRSYPPVYWTNNGWQQTWKTDEILYFDGEAEAWEVAMALGQPNCFVV